MKAFVFEKINSSGALTMREIDKPLPKENQVLVKIVAVSVNAFDYRSIRMGNTARGKILGTDISGMVEAVGMKVSKFKVGDEVFGDLSGCGSGGFAEFVCVPENVLSNKPLEVSFENAAAVPMAAVTALQALRNIGGIKKGQKVLIYGAGGGVGTFAVQLARFFGGEVTAVCGPKNAELVRSLGAEHVIDYTEEDITTSGKCYDLVMAVNGNHQLSAYKRLLSPNGIFVMVGGSLSQVLKSIVFGPLMSIGSRKMRFLYARPDTNDLDFIIKLVEDGHVKPVIDRRYQFHDTADAVGYLNQGHAGGKVIINVAQT